MIELTTDWLHLLPGMGALDSAIEQNRDLIAAWAVLLIVLALLRFPKPMIVSCVFVAAGTVGIAFIEDTAYSRRPASSVASHISH